MTSRPLSLPFPPRGAEAALRGRWIAATLAAGLLAGVLAATKPIVVIGVVGLATATWLFITAPWLCVATVLLLRASLDNSGALVSFGSFNLAGLMGAGLAFGGLLAFALSGRQLPARRVSYVFAAFVVIALLSLRDSLLPDRGLTAWISITAMLALFLWTASLVRTERDMRRITWLTLLGGAFPLLLALYQWLSGTGGQKSQDGYSVVQGTFSFANGFAFYGLVLFALALAMFMRSGPTWRQLSLLGVMAASLTCIFLTYTRSAWIAVPLVVFLMGLLHFRRLLALGAIAAAISVLAAPAFIGAIEERFADLTSVSESDTSSWAWRQHNWSGMIGYADDRPLTGYGLGSYQALSFDRFGLYERNFQKISGPEDGVYAHNDYLNIAVELGFPGLILWTVLLFGMAGICLQARRLPAARPYAATMLALWIGLIIISATDNVQQYAAMLYYPIAITGGLAGMLIAARAAQRASSQRQRLG